MALPLEGFRVVELGTHVVVPNAARFLADWGADVIKVETPKGEEWRKVGPSYCTPMTDEENPLFQEQNANKRLAAINLKSEGGKEAFLKLITKADIFLSNVRMQSLARMGLDYESLKKVNPELIYAHFTGYGTEGPEASKPGFDMSTFWARSGAMRDWSDPEGFPFKPPGGFGDASTSAAFTTGILAAIIGKQRTGKGTFVTSSLQSCGLWYNQTGIVSAQYGNKYPPSPMGARNPFTHIYKCGDGEYVIITVPNYDLKFNHMMEAMGLSQYCDDPRYCRRTSEGLFAGNNLYDFISIMNAKFLEKTQDEWVQVFSEADIACERLLHQKEAAEDEQAWANGCFEKVDFPTSGNSVAFPTVPVRFSEYQVSGMKMAGAVGRDTTEVLLQNGYTEAEIQALREANAVL